LRLESKKVDEMGRGKKNRRAFVFLDRGFDDERYALRCPIFFQSGPTSFRAKSSWARC
jgi:hypothetical protein